MQTVKSRKIISKSPIDWKVGEFENNDMLGQGNSGKDALVKYLKRELEIIVI